MTQRVTQRFPTPLDVRSTLPEIAYDYSLPMGSLLFLTVTSLFAGLWTLSMWVDSLLLKTLFGIMSGQAIGIMFVIGHDAAHGSLTGRPFFDRLYATLAFMPSLHPVCTWKIEHNKLHHGWTNLKGMDPVYPPMAPEEFAALSPWQKRVHRFYRSIWGFGCYYLFDIWWKVLIMRRSEYSKEIPPLVALADFIAVFGFLAFQVFVAHQFAADTTQFLWNLLLCVGLPFFVWNYVMTFVTIQNHTYPTIRWYDNRDEWNYFRAQVEGSIHTEVPAWMDFSFARVFQHTAHHVDKKIPLYRLVKTQASLEKTYEGHVKTVRLTFREFLTVLNDCQMYDYRRHVWMSFPRT